MRNILFITVLILLSGIAKSDTFDSEFSGGVDTTIDQVLSRGLWQEGKKYGSWRLISRNLGWEHTRSYLYMQWLLTDDEKREQIEIQTIPISEFNDTDWRHLTKIEYKNSTFTITYTLRIEPDLNKKAYIKPGVPGKYEITFDK